MSEDMAGASLDTFGGDAPTQGHGLWFRSGRGDHLSCASWRDRWSSDQGRFGGAGNSTDVAHHHCWPRLELRRRRSRRSRLDAFRGLMSCRSGASYMGKQEDEPERLAGATRGGGFGGPDALQQHFREMDHARFKITQRSNIRMALPSAVIGAAVQLVRSFPRFSSNHRVALPSRSACNVRRDGRPLLECTSEWQWEVDMSRGQRSGRTDAGNKKGLFE